MRTCVRLMPLLLCLLALVSCRQGSTGAPRELPEAFRAVPSDALAVGIYSKLSDGLAQTEDASGPVSELPFGKLLKADAVVALCGVGSAVPLYIIDAGTHSADTSQVARTLLESASENGAFCAYVCTGERDAVLLSPSETVVKVSLRHLESEVSILDAPLFSEVAAILPEGDVIIGRNSGIRHLRTPSVPERLRRRSNAFLSEATAWTVFSKGRLIPVQDASPRYFCNFFGSVGDAQSKFATAMPEGVEFYVDIPIESLQAYRQQYEGWLDANVSLESYKLRLSRLKKASGEDPVAIEKHLAIKEVAAAIVGEETINFVRAEAAPSFEGIQENPYQGFLRALYGELFQASDPCAMRSGAWIITGSREALENYEPASDKVSGWPRTARLVAGTPDQRIIWTEDNISIWSTNQ